MNKGGLMEEKENIKDENCTCSEECTCEENCSCEKTCEENCSCEKTCEENCECDDKKLDKSKKKKKEKKEDKLKEYLEKISALEDKLLREKAETVNYRRRKEEEISKMLKYKDEELVTELLPIIDNLESAIKMDDNNLDDELSKFLEGFKMIYANIISVLEKNEIRPIDGVNKPFDPTYHQAVLTEKVEDKESGIVLDVLRKGYILKDKVIRPAMVKVSE
jgi:molecular chaperone GrpE